MELIRDVMTKDIRALRRGETIVAAARAMKDVNIGGVIVTEDDGTVCGFLTDRDIVIRAIADEHDPSTVTIGEVCTHELATLSPTNTVDDAVRMMAEKKIRRIPVVEDGKPVGVVSIGDLAQARDPRSALGTISAAPPNQ